jgi:hypothetical protein
MTKVGVVAGLVLLAVSPLLLLPFRWSVLSLALFLPAFVALGLPVTVSLLGLDERDALFVPFSFVSGMILAGEAHLVLLHARAGWLTPGLLVVGGALLLAIYRRRLVWRLPEVAFWKVVGFVVVLIPMLRIQYRSWASLVDAGGQVVNFFNQTQIINVVLLRDVAGGLPMTSSFIYPLVGTYHVGGHVLIDLVRRLGGLTVFEATFIVGNLFMVLGAEVILLWIIARWFCTRYGTKLLFIAAVVYLGSGGVGALLRRKRLLPAAWALGNDHTEMVSIPYVSTNVARMAGILLTLWLMVVVVECLRRRGAFGTWGAVALGLGVGSLYYYKNSAFFALVAGLALAAVDRAWRLRKLDVAIMLGTATALGVLLHLSMFAFGGTLRLSPSFAMMRSWGPSDAPLATSGLAYLVGWNFRVVGVLIVITGWRAICRAPALVLLVLVLAGSYGAGLFVANFLNHYEERAPRIPAAEAVSDDELSTHNVNLEQFIQVPHALLSIVALGFLVGWLEGGTRHRWARWVVAGVLVVTVLACMSVVRWAFPFVQRPRLADTDLRAAIGVIPVEGTLTATNVPSLSVVALHGHRFYDQKADYFNYGSLRAPFLARRADKARLLSPEVGDADKKSLLTAMGVTHLLLAPASEIASVIPGCTVYYENAHYRVCRVNDLVKR